MPKRNDESKLTEADLEAALAPQQVIALLQAFDVEIPDSLAMGIADYIRLLLRWNEKVSLTTVTTPKEILTRHFGESLFGARVAGIEAGNLLDVGSGAGFPALPIAMRAEGIRERLLEPNVKKAAFLAEACRRMGLVDRVRVDRTRFEGFAAPEAAFDFVTSRAVRITREFVEKCREMLSDSGRIVLWLGQEDIDSVRENPGWIWAEPVLIPGSERRFVIWGSPVSGERST
ncbi:MAG: 16S rRNA (guanine(527)-N(7))-methyltransferase RsmG [Acidobacteriota bacterium]|nr:16S rRNA (guanine(527)-N(7))-methyltransferase RsmG [Acidobacteriota bacterium]